LRIGDYGGEAGAIIDQERICHNEDDRKHGDY
jgi:hypothetical protein